MASRPRGVHRGLAGVVGLALISAVLGPTFGWESLPVVAAQDGGVDSTGSSVVASLNTGAASASSVQESTSSSSGDDETLSVAGYIARGYASTLDEDERRLTIMDDALLTESVCGGEPMVVLKSQSVAANGACLPEQTRYNLSCTCLSGYSNTTTWDFRIREPSSDQVTSLPTTSSEGTVIEVDSLMLLDIPADLLLFKMTGVGSDLVPVKLETSLTGSSGLSLVRSQDVSSLTTAEVSNLDLFEIPLASGFLPTSLTNLSMRNCNLSDLSSVFLESLDNLKSLDLEANKLSTIYDSLPDGIALNRMASINLANNSFITFPNQLLQFPNLQKLDLRGNDISNFTVTSDEFEVISQLAVFEIDSPGGFASGESDCKDGEWLDTHNTKFCVMNDTISTPVPEASTTDSKDSSDTNWTIFVLVAAFGGCLMGFLLLFLALKLINRSKEDSRKPGSSSSSPGIEEVSTSRAGARLTDTLAFYDSLHPTLNADLLNDPLIQSFRIPYRDLQVGRCISKGGFGLVYTGTFKHRRVAIKKIQREKCEKLSQIRMFIREITLMSSLKHPRIVEFIGVAWDSLRNLSAVTEFMERGDLREVLHNVKNQGGGGANAPNGLTWQDRKLTIALHIAEALVYMHSLTPTVIHRDLKSKNVLLNADYEAKLSDFGVSRERAVTVGSPAPDRFMTPGVGTSFWIAPEVLLGKDYDEKADIFSFGVVLSEIDTDDYPYWNSGSIPAENDAGERRAQEQAILEKVALGSLRPTFYNDCPPGVLALAASCLEGRPENRPTASAVVLAIKELIREARFDQQQRNSIQSSQLGSAAFLSNL